MIKGFRLSDGSRKAINNVKESLAEKDVDIFQSSYAIAKQTGSINDLYFRLAVQELRNDLTKEIESELR